MRYSPLHAKVDLGSSNGREVRAFGQPQTPRGVITNWRELLDRRGDVEE